MKRRVYSYAAAVGAALGVAACAPGCTVRYVLQSGYYEAELLTSRRPVEDVLASHALSAGEEQRLALVPKIKAWGQSIGLSATDNYDTYALGWSRTVYNLSASDPLRFQNVTWWFPIVGRMPYLGFFTPEEARRWQAPLETRGLDVWVRTAGAFSTLGWFQDPVLPGMLRWSEADLAETILHELAHATLWIPGSAMFNETFANVVGETAGRQYMIATHGADSPAIRAMDDDAHDGELWRSLLQQVYADLDAVYTDATLDDAQKLEKKQAILASLPDRVSAAGFRHPAGYLVAARSGPWNNARLLQYRTYDDHGDWFRVVLDRNHGDVRAFIDDVARITRGKPDPVAALKAAVQNP